jgi:hypothetical protein
MEEITGVLFSLPRLRGRVGERVDGALIERAPSRPASPADLPRKRER